MSALYDTTESQWESQYDATEPQWESQYDLRELQLVMIVTPRSHYALLV